MTGSDIREFFRQVFGSRLAEQLTLDLFNARADLERLRSEYQGIVADLRSDKAHLSARLAAYEAKAGIVLNKGPVKPSFDFSQLPAMKTKWQILVEENDAKNARELAEEEAQKIAAKAA
jgi:hypothetical protein